jgi:hypothetical protein
MKHVPALAWLLVAAAHAADNQAPSAPNVTGRVLNGATGEPLKKSELALRKQDDSSGQAYHATTDEAGSFSFRVAEGGSYELVVRRDGFVQTSKVLAIAPGRSEAGINVRLTPEGIIAGKLLDAEGDPVAGAMVHAIQFRRSGGVYRYSIAGSTSTNDLGEYRIFNLAPGSYYIGAVRRTQTDFAAVYYPGAQEVGQAVSVDLPAGGELRALNLALSGSHSVKLRGVIHGPSGVPLAGLRVVAAPCDSGPLQRVSTQVRTSEGAFELRDVAPGCYVVAADSFTSGRRLSARLKVEAGKADLEDLRLNLLPPVQLAGQVRTDDESGSKPVRVTVNLDSRLSMVTASGASAENGSLLLNNVVPESYELSVVLPAGYYLKSARFGGVDVLESGLDLSRGAGERLELQIATGGGRVEGSVIDAHDQAVAGARVVLIPDGPPPHVSRFKTGVTDQNGAFEMRDIAPGDYVVYAAAGADAGALQDPNFRRKFERQAKRVSVREHGQEVVQLQLAGGTN